jgi:hypothetical protein
MCHKEIEMGCEDVNWIHLVQDTDQALVNVVITLGSILEGNFWPSEQL